MKFNRKSALVVTFTIVITLMVCFSLLFSSKPPADNLKQQTFAALQQTRNAKKQEVVDYFSQIRMDVESIKDDQKMRRFFDQLQKGSDQNIEYAVDIHYVLEYSEFYDILFVDEGGFVFHSIKKEDDNQTNLLTSNLNPKLTRALQASEDEQFAEFTYYGPSGEPAAFFAVSLEENETHLGWFVLQCAANNVNAILTDRKDLGRTGEVYLVNQDKLMLTDSRFVEDSTILRQEVDTLAVREAFRVASGNKIIEDYRGVKVFSSYEKFDLFGSTWVIIAEIDESEVLTEYYRKHKAYFDAEIVRYLSEQTSQRGKAHYLQRKERRIDIKEFDKVERSQTFVLTTKGVATCTAVAIVYPDKFGYLAHLSPSDAVYQQRSLIQTLMRERQPGMLDEIVRRITRYDIYMHELEKLEFVIVAPHHKSFAGIMETLLAYNIDLANVRFGYNPAARSANISLSVNDNFCQVDWNGASSTLSEQVLLRDDLSTILKQIIRYDSMS